MNRNRARATAMLLAGVAAVALAGPAALAEDARLVQGDDPYYRQAQETLRRILNQQKNTGRAKNVILFVGDGMGVSTVTGIRILEGQRRGVDGESNVLAFEAFPHYAASKTYTSDAQVADSAPTAAAMTTGVKSRNDTIGLDSTAKLEDCESQKTKAVTSIFELAETAGMSTGVVTTTRITHATPAAAYAHIADRDWESDAEMTPEAAQAGCADIARQLVEMRYGDGLEVAMGGGRSYFLPNTADDPEAAGKKGRRKDGRDLTRAWMDRYPNGGAYVWNKEQFDKLVPGNVDHVLGLFEMSHMQYEADRPKDKAGEPSLAEMTTKAIDVLGKNPQGYVLMVEGGRIDHAHHDANAYRSLTDGIAFNEAVKAALAKANTDDTLIVATADHSHTFTINGYPKRGNPLLGVAVGVDDKPILADDKKPYTTLAYANGPAKQRQPEPRPDLAGVDTLAPDFRQQFLVPMTDSETHAGEDVGIYAVGPWAHLFQGTVEQNYIYQVLDFATKLSERVAASAGGAGEATKASAQ